MPHSLALLEALDLLCIADRENMRVACPEAGLRRTSQVKRGVTTIQAPDMGRVFAIAPLGIHITLQSIKSFYWKKYLQIAEWEFLGDQLLVAVNGPTAPSIAIQGFTLDPVGETVLDRWTSHQVSETTNHLFSGWKHSVAESKKWAKWQTNLFEFYTQCEIYNVMLYTCGL